MHSSGATQVVYSWLGIKALMACLMLSQGVNEFVEFIFYLHSTGVICLWYALRDDFSGGKLAELGGVGQETNLDIFCRNIA